MSHHVIELQANAAAISKIMDDAGIRETVPLECGHSRTMRTEDAALVKRTGSVFCLTCQYRRDVAR